MLKRAERNLIVGLDIGTSKVVSLVGEIGLDGSIELLGLGSQPSRGLKKGVVVNIESTVQSIQRAVEEAELMAGCEIHSVFAGIAGSHVRSLNSHGVVAIRDKEVTHGDVEHVIDAAKAVAIPADQKILHVLPQEFIVDGQEGIRDPIGDGEQAPPRLRAGVSRSVMRAGCVERLGMSEPYERTTEHAAPAHGRAPRDRVLGDREGLVDTPLGEAERRERPQDG